MSAYTDYSKDDEWHEDRRHETGGGVEVAEPATSSAEPASALVGSRAVIYLRVSTADQVKTDYDPEGISLPAQRVACQRKAEQLGLTIVDEYIEPGRTATEMTKRVRFQEMLTRVRNERDVDYIIVYKLSRMARNRYDDAIVMADLEKRGIRLVSATESIDDSPTGQLMHGILATINEYQSRELGADVAYKMAQKAKNGGTLGRAPIGYLNVRERIDGHEVRTVAIDPERGPIVRIAFELYATGDYTLADLSDELYDRGLRTRANDRYPEQQVSISKLSDMLRDRYYIGYVKHRGQEYQGRHEYLVDDELFERVQDIIESRAIADERRRVHHHYLKGSLFCGHCKQQGAASNRMILQNAKNRYGTVYTYFVCIGRYDHTCPVPYIKADRLEEAVEEHYASIRFSPRFVADVRAHLDASLNEEETASKLLHQQLTKELKELEVKEENLLDLAADGTLPQAKIRVKLHDIERHRQRLNDRLGQTSDDLSHAARLIDRCLTLLENPQALYLRCDDEQRRRLNQAIFHTLYVVEESDGTTAGGVTILHELKEPFGRLHAAQEEHRAHGQERATTQGDDGATAGVPALCEEAHRGRGGQDDQEECALDSDRGHVPQNANSAPPVRRGAVAFDSLDVLLGGAPLAVGSNSPSLVAGAGFEPATFGL